MTRRVLGPDGFLRTEVRRGAGWCPAETTSESGSSVFTAEWEAANARRAGVRVGGTALPFEPLSFRDFMLYRDHYTGAARGYVSRFRPRLKPVITVAEGVSRRTFPRFRPPSLWDQQPIYYMSNARTFVPSGTPVTSPPYTNALDWELELGFVLDEPLLNATAAEAEAAIGSFVVLNDFSARDVQLAEQRSGFGPQKAKHFLSSMSVTAVSAADVLPHWMHLQASVSIDGVVVARPDASNPRWSLGEALAHASTGEQLLPGEFFGTGTFVRGSGMEIGRWLQPGNTLRLEIEGIGTIQHQIHTT